MNVGFILKTKKDKFKAFVGTPIKDDDDSFINVTATGITATELLEVQTFLRDNEKGIDRIFINPVNSNMTGMIWLSELEEANKEEEV